MSDDEYKICLYSSSLAHAYPVVHGRVSPFPRPDASVSDLRWASQRTLSVHDTLATLPPTRCYRSSETMPASTSSLELLNEAEKLLSTNPVRAEAIYNEILCTGPKLSPLLEITH